MDPRTTIHYLTSRLEKLRNFMLMAPPVEHWIEMDKPDSFY